jgi:hypothetical protein
MGAFDFGAEADEERERERDRERQRLLDEREAARESEASTTAYDSPGDRDRAESGREELSADDMDLPEVVRRSWELTRMELRHELLIDRERRGWLTDFR